MVKQRPTNTTTNGDGLPKPTLPSSMDRIPTLLREFVGQFDESICIELLAFEGLTTRYMRDPPTFKGLD